MDLGVQLSNWPDQPIGVVIEGLSKSSPLAEAGLAGGDVIISVDGQACLSHSHAVELLKQSSQMLCLIVWQPGLVSRYTHEQEKAKAENETDDETGLEEAVAVM